MNMKEDVGFQSVAYVIPSKQSVKKIYTLTTCYNIKDFTEGVYRIHIDANYKNKL